MKKILLIEDERAIGKALAVKLDHEGFEVVNAFDGEEGLQKAKESAYDLIILDLVMPKKDGFTVLEELHAAGNTVPIVIASNLSQESDEKRAKDLGAKDFYIKSNTSLAEIVTKVKTLLNTV